MLTDKQIRGLRPRDKRYQVAEPGGLTIRVEPSGVRTFYYIFRDGGKLKVLRLGKYPVVSLAEARDKRLEAVKLRESGVDPCAVARVEHGHDMKALGVSYIKGYAKPNKKTWKEDKRIWLTYINPIIGTVKVGELRRRDVQAVLYPLVSEGKSRMAGRTLSVLRKALNWALEQDVWPGLEFNPAAGITNPDPGKRRDRALSDDETRVFWRWLVSHKRIYSSTRHALMFLLATGQRSGAVLGLVPSEIDGEWWTVPASRMKMGRQHQVYLNRVALHILRYYQRKKWPQPFPVEDSRSLARVVKRGIDGEIHPLKLQPFTPRDLRRTVATHLGEMDYSDAQIALILGHEKGSVTGIYNRAEQRRLRKEMMERWGDRLVEIIGG